MSDQADTLRKLMDDRDAVKIVTETKKNFETDSVMKRKTLLDLEVGTTDEETVTPSENPGRFQDETVRRAPGNLAEFWRTLLGEVKT